MDEFIYKSEDGVKKNKDKPLFLLALSLLILILALVVSIYLVQQRTYIRSEAYTYSESEVSPVTSGLVSLSNSYVFASPIEAKVSGEYIRITVFVLDDEGSGLENKKVSIGNMFDLNFDQNVKYTDSYGKTFFDVKSDKTGTYIIEVFVDQKSLDQKVKIVFR